MGDRSLKSFCQGLIDIDAEIEKCEKKKKVAQMGMEKLKKVQAHPSYAQTVDPETHLVNEEKIRQFEADIENLETLKETFAKLR